MGRPQAKAGHTRLAISWKRASFGSSARDGQREGRAPGWRGPDYGAVSPSGARSCRSCRPGRSHRGSTCRCPDRLCRSCRLSRGPSCGRSRCRCRRGCCCRCGHPGCCRCRSCRCRSVVVIAVVVVIIIIVVAGGGALLVEDGVGRIAARALRRDRPEQRSGQQHEHRRYEHERLADRGALVPVFDAVGGQSQEYLWSAFHQILLVIAGSCLFLIPAKCERTASAG